MSRSLSRREAILGGTAAIAIGTQVPAIFGGQVVEPNTHPYARLFEAAYPALPGGGVPLGRCGATHIGNGWLVSAAHCGTGDNIQGYRLNGQPLQRINGRYWAFIADDYDPAGLAGDYLFLYDPQARTTPAIPVASADEFAALRARINQGQRVTAKAIGYGTTRLDENGRPTNPSTELKDLPVEIVSANSSEISVTDPTRKGGVCVGDSGSALVIEGKIYGVVSHVTLNPETGAYCDRPGWRAVYKSLEPRLSTIAALPAIQSQFTGG